MGWGCLRRPVYLPTGREIPRRASPIRHARKEAAEGRGRTLRVATFASSCLRSEMKRRCGSRRRMTWRLTTAFALQASTFCLIGSWKENCQRCVLISSRSKNKTHAKVICLHRAFYESPMACPGFRNRGHINYSQIPYRHRMGFNWCKFQESLRP